MIKQAFWATASLAALAALWSLGPRPTYAESEGNILGAQSTTTITTTGTFQNPSVLPQMTGRVSCLLQYKGPGPTGYVFFGPAAPSSTASGFRLAQQGTFSCGNADGSSWGNAVWLSGTANDTWEILVK